MYDYLIVGSGLYGAVFAYEAGLKGKSCLVIDRRAHIGGNIYTENVEGIEVHRYGAHIFHTSDKSVWDYIRRFADFNGFINSPMARYKNEIYNLPFNMNTFSRMWNVFTPAQAREIIERQIKEAGIIDPQNLEQQAISMVGRDIYEKLIKGYTAKQWGRPCDELPAFIIKRLPVRFTDNNNYFNDAYQGIPVGGYTKIIEKLLQKADVRLNADFFCDRRDFSDMAKKTVFTGRIDHYFDKCFGELEYRTLDFETECLDTDDYQGCAVVNYTEYEVPYTRIIEHKHFDTSVNFESCSKTVITREYPARWREGAEAYYPVNDAKNSAVYERYRQKAALEPNVIFGGRLGTYRYLDMHQVIKCALTDAERELA